MEDPQRMCLLRVRFRSLSRMVSPVWSRADRAFTSVEGNVVLCERIQAQCSAARARLVYGEQYAAPEPVLHRVRERHAEHAWQSTVIEAEIIDESEVVVPGATWLSPA